LREAQQHRSLFRERVTRIRRDAAQRIAEDRRRVLERDLVFGQVCRRFLRVPLELQPSLYLWLAL